MDKFRPGFRVKKRAPNPDPCAPVYLANFPRVINLHFMETKSHMTSQEFRRWGHALIDWIAAYQDRVETFPVMSPLPPGAVRARLPEAPPVQGEDFSAILADLDRVILPGITHWQSPNFFAYFPANTSGPSILGELVSAGLGVQGMLWATSPACTELETHVMDWMAMATDLPPAFRSSGAGGGVIQDSASGAVLCALLAARERATAFQTNSRGCTGRLVAYTTSHAHSSVEKAVRIAGIGTGQLRIVDVDQHHAMRPEALQERIDQDRRDCFEPFFVSATLGTTSSNAFDPVPAIGAICRKEKLWLHVDAAMSGTAAICPEYRHLFAGLELADSYAFNPHKWMFVNFDCDCFYVADRAALIRALSILPEYLKNRATESGAVIDYRDWQVSLGRRFRALKLWFVLRYYGLASLQNFVRSHVNLTQEFAGWVKDSPLLELAAPVPLNLVCFRHRAGEAASRTLLEKLNRSGKVLLSHTVLDNRYTLRFCVGQTHTEQRHVRAAWELISQTAAQVG